MKKEYRDIGDIASVVFGESSSKVILYVHGKNGCKEDAAPFASVAVTHGWQVLSVDLPKHGERTESRTEFLPWQVIPELRALLPYICSRWSRISLCANSIGAWFVLLAFEGTAFEKAFFISPVLDMEKLIRDMMAWASVSMERLKREREIETNFGETLSWEYYSYAKEKTVTHWESPTFILYGEKDHLIKRDTVDVFAHRFFASLTVMAEGEHWFHTEEQLDFMKDWANRILISDKEEAIG